MKKSIKIQFKSQMTYKNNLGLAFVQAEISPDDQYVTLSSVTMNGLDILNDLSPARTEELRSEARTAFNRQDESFDNCLGMYQKS